MATVSPLQHYESTSEELAYRKLALETVTSEALFNGQDYPQVLLRGRFDPWADFDHSSSVIAGGVTIIQFPETSKAIVNEYSTPDLLRAYFATNEDGNCETRRRLFLLEGLDARMIEILGSRLRMHPGVFLAHSTDPGSFDMIDTDGFLHDPSQYWIVQIQQLHRMSDGFSENAGIYFDDQIKPKRLAGRFVRKDPPIYFTSHLITFWNHKYDDSSWDALIIVDPLYRPTVYKQLGIPELTPIPKGSEFNISEELESLPKIPRIHTKRLPDDSTTWSGQRTLPSESFKHRLIEMYSKYDHQTTQDPASAGRYCQGIIFSMWMMTVRALEERYMSLWDNELFAWHHDKNAKWRVAEYQKFSSQQLVARRIKKDYLDVCRKLGIRLDLSGGTNVCAAKARSWAWLLERLDILEKQIEDMMTTSTQRASVEESISSNQQALATNEQARSVGRLTAFAALLVPFTIISGIFSMGGQYAVGQPSFWIFWAVALPVSCATMLCLLCMGPVSSVLHTQYMRAFRHLPNLKKTSITLISRSKRSHGEKDLV